jgi:tryptophan halogenase
MAQRQTPDEPALKWVGADQPPMRPDVVQVQAKQDVIALLLGTRDAADAGRARLERRIVLGSVLAKQLAAVLGEVVRNHEAQTGSVDAMPAGRPGGAYSDADVPPGAKPLFERVRALDAAFGFEKSFKLVRKSMREDRLILGVPSALATPEALLGACRDIGMPPPYLDAFARELGGANTIGFGYEGGGHGGVYKVYLEFWDRLRERILRDPANREPALLFLGFKWEASEGGRAALARYICHPLLSVRGILARLEALYAGRSDSSSLVAARAILALAARRIGGDDSFVYVEAGEEGNPRKSFDLNFYKAGLRVRDLLPALAVLCREYSIAAAALDRVEAEAGGRAFGHLSGGIGRDGQDFLTVYYELEAL